MGGQINMQTGSALSSIGTGSAALKQPPMTVGAGKQRIAIVQEGQALNITGAAGTVGVAYLLDPALGGTNSSKSWPIGTGALAQIGPYAGTQRVLVTCSVGSVEAAVGSAVLGAAQSVVVAGKLASTGRSLVAFGDSKLAYNASFGYLYSVPTNIGTSYIALKNASQNTPAGNATLEYRAADKAFRYTAPTDTAGPWLVTTGLGVYTLKSGNPLYTLPFGVKLFPLVDLSDTITRGAWQWARTTGGMMFALEALTGRRFKILPDHAIPGGFALSAPGNWYDLAIQSGASAILENPGTNDIPLGGALPAAIVAARRACWAQAYAAGIPVLAMLIDPRWGLDAVGGATVDSPAYTATFQARITAVNSGLIAEAKNWPNVHIVDNWSGIVDATSTQGRAQPGLMVDGLHYLGGGAFQAGVGAARVLNTLWPNDAAAVNIGAGSYYSAENPRGNLLPTNQGAFAGTAGSLGTAGIATPSWAATTACSKNDYVINASNLYVALNDGPTGTVAPSHPAGSVSDGAVTWLFVCSGVTAGLATGYALTRSGTINALCHKVQPTDGSPAYQELVIKGATALTDQILLSGGAITMGNTTTGDVLDYQVEGIAMDPGCYGVGADLFLSGPGLAVQAFQLRSVIQGIPPGVVLTIGTEPYVLQSTVTGINARHYINSLIGATFRVRLRNADLHKVI